MTEASLVGGLLTPDRIVEFVAHDFDDVVRFAGGGPLGSRQFVAAEAGRSDRVALMQSLMRVRAPLSISFDRRNMVPERVRDMPLNFRRR